MKGSIIPLLRARYVNVAAELLAPLLEVIDQAERTFEGDLQKFHILLAVAMRTARHPELSRLNQADARAGTIGELPSLWTNVNSIAMSIGVPKETVRRKVASLVREGWLEKRDHSIRYTPRAAVRFGPIRELLLRLAASNYVTVSDVLLRHKDGDEDAVTKRA